MKKLALHWQILLGMLAGIVLAVIALQFGTTLENGENTAAIFIQNWIKPFGTIFINLLKMIAVPLIVTSLIKGVADLQDISKLSRMGGRTILFYVCTTIIAVSIGLIMVNLIEPGGGVSEATRDGLLAQFKGDADSKIMAAAAEKARAHSKP